ncbi:MAG: hypothetical protein ACFB4I_03215 [Cyanophyceae cyanobacterium]
MKCLFVLAAVSTLQFAEPVLAQQQTRSVSLARLRDGEVTTVTVHEGYGFNINFIPTGEIIRRVWLDDPSRVTVDFDGDLNSTGAQVIHLKRIEPLTFRNLPQTPATLLSVVTETRAGQRNLYQFRLTYGSGIPEYSALTLYPESRSTPLIDVGMLGIQATLEDVATGRRIVQEQGLLKRSDPLWDRIQEFITLARNGESIVDAAERAGVSMAIVRKLAHNGLEQRLSQQYRPLDPDPATSNVEPSSEN